MTMKKIFNLVDIAASAAMVFACSAEGLGDAEYYGAKGDMDSAGMPAEGLSDPSDPSGGNNDSRAGRVTAGEWNDLDNWQFWGGLMLSQGKDEVSEIQDGDYYEGNGSFYQYCPYWKFYTNNRVAVNVTNGGAPAAGVKVVLKMDGKPVWSAVTDNLGQANCWIGLYEETTLP